MFIAAHAFLGMVIGLLFWRLSGDRRLILLCIFGAILPDLLDKPLYFLVPDIVGCGRTIGHTLLVVGIVITAAALVWYYRRSVAGLAFACAVFSHQLLDEIWTLPATWYFPLLGPFPVIYIPDYVGHYFWIEVSTPSEWVFGGAIAITLLTLPFILPLSQGYPGRRTAALLQGLSVLALGIMGASLLAFGLTGTPGPVFAATYNPVTSVMAGVVALGGAALLVVFFARPFRNR